MLFVPGADYVRLADHCSNTSAGAAEIPAAADADEQDVEEEKEEDGEDADDDDSVVSTSILFASQAQYLGHSNQVSLITATQPLCVSIDLCPSAKRQHLDQSINQSRNFIVA